MILAWQFQKLLMGMRLHGVHHLFFGYKDPKFPLRKDCSVSCLQLDTEGDQD